MTEREVVSLKEYFERRLDEQRAYFEAKLEAVDKTMREATESLNKRLEGMNEFRSALKDQNVTFLSRNEYFAQHEKLEADIRVLRESKAMLEGKASQQAVNVSTIIGIAGLLVGVVALIIHITG